MQGGFNNEQVRKAQLEKLDQFVKTLYDECDVFSQYMKMDDLQMLYMHIHELIQEMLQCKTTDEFMAMIQQFHQAVAGVLIVVAPANANQVKQDMKESYTDFKADNFDDLLQKIHETSVKKFGKEGAEKAKEMEEKMKEERTKEETEELLDTLELKDYADRAAQREQKNKTEDEDETKEQESSSDDVDPLDSFWENN